MKETLHFDDTEQTFGMSFGEVHTIGGSSVTVEQTYNPDSENAQSGKAVAEALSTIKMPSKVSELENDAGYLTEHQDISGKADKTEVEALGDRVQIAEDNASMVAGLAYENSSKITGLENQNSGKADKPSIETSDSTSYIFEFANTDNAEKRLAEVANISFTFGNGEYPGGYTSGLSFDSGATPTAIDYTDSGILNWVGTDCTNVDGLSIFQPSANTHYDIVFYFNGTQFIGLVNGFVPATGNVVSV